MPFLEKRSPKIGDRGEEEERTGGGGRRERKRGRECVLERKKKEK